MAHMQKSQRSSFWRVFNPGPGFNPNHVTTDAFITHYDQGNKGTLFSMLSTLLLFQKINYSDPIDSTRPC